VKVVLDTNVFIAAFATRGVCEAVMELCLDRHQVGVSRDLLQELRRNLVKKVKLPPAVADEMVRFVASRSEIVRSAQVSESLCRDPDDLKILGTAVAFEADDLITGDQDLLVLRRIGATEIVSPREGARRLAGQQQGA
jgi:hypothetical protein